MRLARFAANFGALLILSIGAAAQSGVEPSSPHGRPRQPEQGTAPLILDGNRIYAQLTFVRPDGSEREALAFVDMGSPSMLLSPALSKELELGSGKRLALKIGEMTVSIDGSAVTADEWLSFPIAGSRKVEALLPAGVLKNYEVVIDYAARTLTLAKPGSLHPQGTPVPLHLDRQTGLAAVDAIIDGRTYPITIDCGSAYTWLSRSAAQVWLRSHLQWKRGTGAVGLSNMRMADDGIETAGTILRISQMSIGALRLEEIGALAIGFDRKNWDFIDWYSKKNALPVIGWLGGNVLKGFRITLDYAHRTSYWQRQAPLDPHDLDQIGLTLITGKDGYAVAAVATQDGHLAVDGVEAGDRLLQIDSLHTGAASASEVLAAMHGQPDQIKALVLERDGKQFTVQARVRQF